MAIPWTFCYFVAVFLLVITRLTFDWRLSNASVLHFLLWVYGRSIFLKNSEIDVW